MCKSRFAAGEGRAKIYEARRKEELLKFDDNADPETHALCKYAHHVVSVLTFLFLLSFMKTCLVSVDTSMAC